MMKGSWNLKHHHVNQHQQPACALKHNNMVFLYWHELHIKKKKRQRHYLMSYFLFLCIFSFFSNYSHLACTLTWTNLMLLMPWKKSLKLLKILRLQTLLSFHATWIYHLLSLRGTWLRINQTYLGLPPSRMPFSPGQPSSHWLLTFNLLTSDPSLLHATILFL